MELERPNTDAEEAPVYCNPSRVKGIIDGDTYDVELDLGYETFIVERVRAKGIDTREIHFVSHDSEEYERGMVHTEFTARWVKESRKESEEDFPFVLYSAEYDRGTYGRVIGDLYSKEKEEWLAVTLFNEFDDVKLYS